MLMKTQQLSLTLGVGVQPAIDYFFSWRELGRVFPSFADDSLFPDQEVKWSTFFKKEDWEIRTASIESAISAYGYWQGIYRIHLPGEQEKSIEEYCTRLSTSDGVYYTGYIRVHENSATPSFLSQGFYNSLRNAVERASIVAVTDTIGRWVYVNDKFCALSEYSKVECIGESFQLIHWPDNSTHNDFWNEMATGEVWRGDLCNRSKSGNYFWLDTVISPVFDQAGKIVRYLWLQTEITHKKEIELSIKQSEQFNLAVLSALRSMIAVVTFEGNLVFTNKRWLDIEETDCFFWGGSPLIGENIFERFRLLQKDESFAVQFNTAFEAIKRGDTNHITFEFACVNSVSTKQWYLVSLTELVEIENRILLRFTDISSQKSVEAELESSHSKIEFLLENMRDAVFIEDTDGILTYANQTFLNEFNLNEQSIGRVSILDFVHDDCQQRLQDIHEARMTGENELVELEFRRAAHLGPEKWYEARVTVLKEDDRIIGAQTVLRDSTEKKQLITELTHKEAQLKRSIRNLEAKNDELLQFSYIVSHNLRSSVANIIGLSGLLERSKELSGTPLTYSQLISQSAKQMDLVVRELSEILSIQNHDSSSKSLIYPQEVIMRIANELDIANYMEFRVSHPEQQYSTFKPFFESIFYNVLSNASKYQSGIRPLRIRCEIEFVPGALVIRCQDNGLGMDLKRIGNELFGMYKRFHPDVSAGRGIGLYMMKKQLEIIGGWVEYDSTPDLGTSVTVHFEDKENE
jgi:PAS domain S-box-containing protein